MPQRTLPPWLWEKEQLAAQAVGAARAVVKAFGLEAEFCQVYEKSAAIYLKHRLHWLTWA